jgi:hypothetical protein
MKSGDLLRNERKRWLWDLFSSFFHEEKHFGANQAFERDSKKRGLFGKLFANRQVLGRCTVQ